MHLVYRLSCPALSRPACPSTFVFACFSPARLSVRLPVCLYTWLTLFMQVWLDIIYLLALLILLWAAVFPTWPSKKEACCPCPGPFPPPPPLAPPSFLCCIQMNNHTVHQTDNTPPLARVDVQPSANRYAAFILSSTSNHGRSLAAVFSSFFSLPRSASSKGFMIPPEAMLNLGERDLGKMLRCQSDRSLLL